jgi:lipoic acid synthetase
MPALNLAKRQPRPRLPDWLRLPLPTSASFAHTRALLDELKLHTVCESAKCPNHWECWSKGTATFMIGGDRCTRACRFCAVTTARPFALDQDEPGRVAEAAHRMRLKHVVITAVARDDLHDGGAEHFCKTIQAFRALNPGVIIEVLTPDFNDSDAAIEAVLEARPHIFNHNLETVRRLTPSVRSRATYDRSLSVLRKVKATSLLRHGKDAWNDNPDSVHRDRVPDSPPLNLNLDLNLDLNLVPLHRNPNLKLNPPAPHRLFTKSGLMLGLGETESELFTALDDLREAGCDILTLGQYLQPTLKHLPVSEFVPPEKFQQYGARARQMGFLHVASGPLVRSSYHADEFPGIK